MKNSVICLINVIGRSDLTTSEYFSNDFLVQQHSKQSQPMVRLSLSLWYLLEALYVIDMSSAEGNCSCIGVSCISNLDNGLTQDLCIVPLNAINYCQQHPFLVFFFLQGSLLWYVLHIKMSHFCMTNTYNKNVEQLGHISIYKEVDTVVCSC